MAEEVIQDAEVTVAKKSEVKQETVKPAMSTALQNARTTSDLPIHEAVTLFNGSALLKPGETKQTVLIKLNLGRDLGISDVASLTGLSVSPNGSLVIGAQLMQLLIKRSGKYRLFVKQRDSKGSKIEVMEKIDGKWESLGVPVSFMWEDVERAGLSNKETYKRWPIDMMFARCAAATFRTYCPDALSGVPVYLPEELENSGYRSGQDGELIPDTVEVKSVTPTPSKSPSPEALSKAKSLLTETKSTMSQFKSLYATDDITKLNTDQLNNLISTLEKKQRAA